MPTDPLFAVRSGDALGEALAVYKAETGHALLPGDPRREHLRVCLLLLADARTLIDAAGKANLLKFTDDTWIEELGALYGATLGARTPPVASIVDLQFNLAGPGSARTIPAGTRATDGTNLWSTTETVESDEEATYIQSFARCATAGAQSNGVAIGLINSLVDPIAGVSSVENISPSSGGAELESLAAYRARLRLEPEAHGVAGTRAGYRGIALRAHPDLVDVAILGPEDEAEIAEGNYVPAPGEVLVCMLTRPPLDPTVNETVQTALRANKLVTDTLVFPDPMIDIVEFDISGVWYINQSRADEEAAIQDAVEQAIEDYITWQTSKIGRDINPSELVHRIMAAGAKRVVINFPVLNERHFVGADQVATVVYDGLVYGGLEED